MKPFLTLLLVTLCAATTYGQTIKALSYNSTNNTIVATQRVTFPALGVATGSAAAPSLTYAIGTNVVGTFATTALGVGPYLGFSVNGTRQFYIATNTIRAELPISFSTTTNAAETRTNLSLGLPALTNTNVTNFRTAIGLGATNDVEFRGLLAGSVGGSYAFFIPSSGSAMEVYKPIWFGDRGGTNNIFEFEANDQGLARTNLGLPLAALTNTSNVTMMRALSGSTNANHPFSGSFEFKNSTDDVFLAVVSNGIILNITEP